MGSKEVSDVEPFLLAFFGRSGSCMMHALLLNFQGVYGPEIHLSAETLRLITQDGSLHLNQLAACRSKSSPKNNLFHHLPSEGFGLDFSDHEYCSCNKVTASSRLLLHTHGLLYDEKLFQTTVGIIKKRLNAGQPLLKVVVTTMSFADAVLTLHKHNRCPKLTAIEDLLLLCAVTLENIVATKRLQELEKKSDVILIDIDSFNNYSEAHQLDIQNWLAIPTIYVRPESLLIRKRVWTGGYQPVFGANIRPILGSKKIRRFLNSLSPMKVFGASKAIFFFCLFVLDIISVFMGLAEALLRTDLLRGRSKTAIFYLQTRISHLKFQGKRLVKNLVKKSQSLPG